MVDSAQPASGELATSHDTQLGDSGEISVWHELGHNFVTAKLPLKAVVELYSDYEILFHHLQEFYADLTALYHSSPRTQRYMMIRLIGLDHYNAEEQHTRAAHGIGAMFLAHVMQEPDKWPSLHFPPSVPKQQVELNTIIYLYEHWEPQWTIAEAQNLRTFVNDFVKTQGNRTLKRKGLFKLPNKLTYSLMAGQDHKHQVKRDQWVAQQLEQLIADKRADTFGESETYDPPLRRQRNSNTDKQVLRIYWPD
jgi:hypothetical protein